MFKKKQKLNQPASSSQAEQKLPEPRTSHPSCPRRCVKYLYDRENKQFCGRTCSSWRNIIVYSIFYLIFLSTYTLIFLFASLSIIKALGTYESIDKLELMTYADKAIGLSATPTSANSLPIINYQSDKGYEKYVNELEEFFSKRRKRQVVTENNLGPCGSSPFGYWKKPCVVIRINKQIGWSAKPLINTTNLDIPQDVKEWMKLDQEKLWLHCHGYHSYDREHIGKILYYPDPPGFEANAFPLEMGGNSPVIGVQFVDFTLGLSVAIECSLWYEGGSSSTTFILYVTPKQKVFLNADKIKE
ncbi:probable sodium/potassium-transporting ATPase subunit beta-3 [Leptidea sinapis]|uniref:probable sodium/potassium-transporting ATPase subunit beta-3 n=1 Tax=Leptidea sinapis TaxID=189913 RepID=UPI0021C3A969|nr:probable sodium/potassium-transporting ATPase subunit beta-3 [Leptidea sinapis]